MFAHATRPLSVSREYVGLERGRPSFTHGFPGHALLRIPLGHVSFAYGPLTLSGRPFQVLLLASMVLTAVLQPRGASPPVWPPPRSLAATDGISVISVPAGTKMFQFPAFASLSGCRGFATAGCPIRTSGGHSFAAARPGFSQLGTSFVASESRTIPPPPRALEMSLVSTSHLHDSRVVKGPCGHESCASALPAPACSWWACLDSNQRPHAYQACALTS